MLVDKIPHPPSLDDGTLALIQMMPLVADQGFLKGAPTPKGRHQLIIRPNFPEN